MADYDNEEDRKMFVGGLPQDVSQEDLKDYFETFGELESVKLKMDPMTGRSRGFAFLLYKDVESIDNAASNKDHKLKGKSITVKKADIKPGKIYVGKLPDSGVGEDEIKEHFSQYGSVTEVIRPIDKSKDNTPKNFCFVTFEKERVAKKLIEEGTCNIGGHKMQIKQVTPNPRDPSNRGGMGGGRGGYGGSPWMNQGGGWGGQAGGWGNDGGYGGYGGQGGGQWGNDGGYGGYGGGDMGQGGWGAGGGGWGQGGGQQWGGQGGGTWSTGGRGGGRGGGGGKMRGGRGGGGGGGRGRGRGGQARPY